MFQLIKNIFGFREVSQNKSVVQTHQAETASDSDSNYGQSILGERHVLTVLDSRGIYKRIVRVVDDAGVSHRVELTDVYADELTFVGLKPSIDAVIRYTSRQAATGMLQSLIPDLQCKNKPEKPAKKPKTTPVMAVETKDAASEAGPQSGAGEQQGLVSQSDSTGTSNVPSDKKAQEFRKQKKCAGKVTFAGFTQFSPPAPQKPYEVFSVTVKPEGQSEASFSGIDLQEKFIAGEFAVGDFVEIEFKGKIDFEVNEGGKVKKRKKNLYSVTKI